MGAHQYEGIVASPVGSGTGSRQRPSSVSAVALPVVLGLGALPLSGSKDGNRTVENSSHSHPFVHRIPSNQRFSRDDCVQAMWRGPGRTWRLRGVADVPVEEGSLERAFRPCAFEEVAVDSDLSDFEAAVGLAEP